MDQRSFALFDGNGDGLAGKPPSEFDHPLVNGFG